MTENINVYRDTSKMPTPDEVNMASRAAATLDSHYKGYKWQVALRDGIAIVRNQALSPDHGYFINLSQEPDFERAVMRAGGEILERSKIARNRFDLSAYADAADKAFHNIGSRPE
jgi:hypothetical protein